MSLILFLFYWVGIPLLIIIVTRGLLRQSKTSLHKGLIIVISAMVFLGLLWLAEGRKWLVDQQVWELCAKDGGVKVYETVKTPSGLVDKYGVIRIPNKPRSQPSDEYYYESFTRNLKNKNPKIWQSHYIVYRQFDNKLLGEAISYTRQGGDLPGPWHPSSFRCPEKADITDLKKRVFIK